MTLESNAAKNCKAYRQRKLSENPDYYKAQAQKYRENRNAWRARQRVIVRDAKRKPCVDCGFEGPPEVMDLDHVRGSKELELGSSLDCSDARLRAEIAKCEVRCPTCHRLRHYYENLRTTRNEHGPSTPTVH